MSEHIIVGNGFGKLVHAHPFTGEPWTDETAKKWQRDCAGRGGRSGGVHVPIESCDCAEGASA